jgi:WD40 repeat protein
MELIISGWTKINYLYFANLKKFIKFAEIDNTGVTNIAKSLELDLKIIMKLYLKYMSKTDKDFKKIFVKKKFHLTGHRAAVYTLSAYNSPDTFISGGGDGFVVQWNANNLDIGTVIAQVKSNIFSVEYIPQLHRLAIGNMYGGIHWIDLNENKNIKNVAHHSKGTFALKLVGDYIYSGGGCGKFTKWNIETCQPMETIQITEKSIRSIDYSPARNEFALGSSDYSIYILDGTTLELKRKIEDAHSNSVFVVKYSTDGQYIMSGGRDAQLKVWNLANDFYNESSQPAHWFTINDIAFQPSGNYFATASRDKHIRIWDAHNFHIVKSIDKFKLAGHRNSVNALHWLHDGLFVSCSDDRTVMGWEFIENDEATIQELIKNRTEQGDSW